MIYVFGLISLFCAIVVYSAVYLGADRERQFDERRRAMSRTVSITSMGEYRLVKPVLVHIEQEAIDGRFIAYWPETECSAYDWTDTAALDRLKVEAAQRYDELLKLPASRLSHRQVCWLAVFESVIGLKVPT